MIVDLNPLLDYALLALRIVVAIVFLSSGFSHARNSAERGEELGVSKGSAFVLGLVEIIAALSVAFGFYIQIGAALLIIVMLDAIGKKLFIWNVGFYSGEGMGWHYGLLFLCANLVFLTEAGQLVIVG